MVERYECVNIGTRVVVMRVNKVKGERERAALFIRVIRVITVAI